MEVAPRNTDVLAIKKSLAALEDQEKPVKGVVEISKLVKLAELAESIADNAIDNAITISKNKKEGFPLFFVFFYLYFSEFFAFCFTRAHQSSGRAEHPHQDDPWETQRSA